MTRLQGDQLTACVQVSLLPTSLPSEGPPLRPGRGHIRVYSTKDMWSNESQTTSASGLSDRITVRLGGCLHVYTGAQNYELLSQNDDEKMRKVNLGLTAGPRESEPDVNPSRLSRTSSTPGPAGTKSIKTVQVGSVSPALSAKRANTLLSFIVELQASLTENFP